MGAIINADGTVVPDDDTIAQIIAVLNAQGGGAAIIPAFGTTTFVSGTAQQNTANAKKRYYLAITGGSAGTVKVDIGADNTTAQNLVPATAADAVASQVIPFDVPAKWYAKVTVAVATIVANTVTAVGV